MNEMSEIKDIERKIYNIRGVEVMLDSDLAKQYKCANGTKTINQAVKRNQDIFPNDFYFQLNEIEYLNLKSQFGTTNFTEHGGVRKMPYVFAEQNDSYHDRFIIIDRIRVFHSGASFKDLGKKCFSIHEIENIKEIDKMINIIKNLI